MKLRRTWPAICIWAVFLIFDIVMVASLCFFLGLFPSDKALIYSVALTVLSVLVMSVITLLLGKLCDRLDLAGAREKVPFRIIYAFLVVLIIAAGVYYRVEILSNSSGDIIGKYSLYENAMIGGGEKTPEYDLLSIAYSTILKGILFFSGNIVSVPFLFQIACFTIFMICGFFTVKKLLGMAASVVFTAYVAFMPVFTYSFTGLLMSTDSLFMAMFGIELLVMALFLKGSCRKVYRHWTFAIWYIFVGAVVGFMAYVDAGTIIMILPFIIAVLFIKGTVFKEEFIRLLFVVFGAVLAFAGMIAQEQGLMMAHATLSKWAGFYFHNLNTFSMFWTYTDHKVIYLVTAVAMSGVMVGFWKNRNFEKISPWLVSMLLIFATVPFMGATRMNTQVFVTVYYAFILACVADLITTHADETADEVLSAAAASGSEEVSGTEVKENDPEPKVITPENAAPEPEPWQKLAEPEQAETDEAAEPETMDFEQTSESDTAAEEREPAFDADSWQKPEEVYELVNEPVDEPAFDTDSWQKPEEEHKPVDEPAFVADSWDKSEEEPESVQEPENETYPWDKHEDRTESAQETANETYPWDKSEDKTEPAKETDHETYPWDKSEEEHEPAHESDRPRFVPEGMVLPEDDEDADLTPRMRMPQLSAPVGPDGKAVKLKVGGNSQLLRRDDRKEDKPRDDFDIEFRPGDDFDI